MNDRLQEGIAAFQAGERERAQTIFEEIVRVEPDNDTAWYYLAAAQTDFNLRRQYLERVLQLNPQHQRAREVLDRMNTSVPTEPPVAARSAMPPPASPPPMPSGAIPGEATAGGIKLPVTIPGAPAQVGIAEAFRDGLMLMMKGVAALQSRVAEYDGEISQASWWRFWLLVTIGAVITTVVSFISQLLFQFQLSSLGLQFNIVGLILGVVLGIPMTWAITFAGVAVSHWWTTRQGSRVPMYQHAYATALPYVPAQVVGGILSLVLSFIGLGGIGSLISFALSIYALYVIYQAYQRLHRFADGSSSVIAIVMFFVGAIAAAILVGIVVGLVGVSAVLPIAIMR